MADWRAGVKNCNSLSGCASVPEVGCRRSSRFNGIAALYDGQDKGKWHFLTKGFVAGERFRHFHKHVQQICDVVASDEIVYETMADQFLGLPKKPSTLECKRAGGDIVRFDCKTDEYGICDANGFIRTYFRADPSYHKLSTNFHYLCQECRTIFLASGGKQIV